MKVKKSEQVPSNEEASDVDTDDVALDGVVIDDADLSPIVLDALPVKSPRLDAGAVTRYDPFQAYLQDIRKYELLTPEEEKRLAVHYHKTGDLDAAARMVTSNLRLVVKIAYDYRRAYKNLLDLIQEGNIGLMQAVKKYDPYRGVKLSSYAAWWIRAYMLRFILNNWRMVKIGTTQAQRKLFFNLQKEKAKLSARGIEPTSDLIAKELHVSVEDVENMDRRLSGGEVSLDAPLRLYAGSEGSDATRVDTISTPEAAADDVLADEEMGQILKDKISNFGKTLKDKESMIFKERLISEDPKTLQELGEKFGVSRERVRQLEKRVQDKLRAYLQEQLGEDAFAS